MGDPFEEKRLIEACLELLDEGLVVGIQDLGGAGLACATSETAARGGVGMDVDVAAVPRREPGMEPWEVMTSESQERMLAIVTPEAWPAVAEVCRRWEVRATVVGRVDRPGDRADGGPARAPADPRRARTVRCWPTCRPPRWPTTPPSTTGRWPPPADLAERRADDPGAAAVPGDCGGRPARPAGRPALGLPPVRPPAVPEHGGGPGRRRRPAPPGRARACPPSGRGLAVTTDANPRWCALDPRAGTALMVAEGVANVACVGARPVAVVNCLNFGNPEHPEVMWQLSEAIDGMAEACRALGLPVIGGNVSLYNESGGRRHRPHPGGRGARPGRRAAAGARPASAGPTAPRWCCWGRRPAAGGAGPAPSAGGQPLGRRGAGPARRRAARRSTWPPTAGWSTWWPAWWPRRWPEADGLLCGVHDVSGGGLAVALAEMAVRSGIGCVGAGAGADLAGHAELFSELPSRVLVATDRPDEVLARAGAAGVPAAVLGRAGGDRLVVDGLVDLPLAEVRRARATGALPRALGEAA